MLPPSHGGVVITECRAFATQIETCVNQAASRAALACARRGWGSGGGGVALAAWSVSRRGIRSLFGCGEPR
jgi:hypothetical protein